MALAFLIGFVYDVGFVGTICHMAQLDSEREDGGGRWWSCMVGAAFATLWPLYWAGTLLSDGGTRLLLPPPGETH